MSKQPDMRAFRTFPYCSVGFRSALSDLRALRGTTVAGRYRLDRYLDEGNFGIVYGATQLAFGGEMRQVAVKIGKRPMSNAEANAVFAEAAILTKLVDNTPDSDTRQHFVMIHDAGRCAEGEPLAGHPYVVMELVPDSLARRLREKAFPLCQAMTYFDQILKAVAWMHQGFRGPNEKSPTPLVHRDIKPGNVLLIRRADGPDLVKISDFGLTVKVDTLLGWVQSGGDLAYLAPEAFSHNICSKQSDVYALALLFYQMIGQQNPFSAVGSYLRGADAKQRDELRKLHLTARQLEQFKLLDTHVELRRKKKLAEVLRSALAADMNSRPYQDAADFRAAWEQAKGDTTSPPKAEQSWETARRLTAEARQCFAVCNQARGRSLLEQAEQINRDPKRVPDRMLVGDCYLLGVEQRLAAGQIRAAGELAAEGHERRKCRSTCLAMALYFQRENSPLWATFQQRAQTSADTE